MENLTVNLEELFNEAKDKAIDDGALSREEWNELIEELLEEKRQFSELHDDESWVEIRESLQARYDDFMSETEEM
jgi:polyhydroxyalkanoate synthesis regulator phasin